MDASTFQHFKDSLIARRDALAAWLVSTPQEEKNLRLGQAQPTQLDQQFQVIDTAIGEATDQTLGLCEVCHDYIETRRLEMDYTCHICLDHLSDEERRRLENELELAMVVQRALLPQGLPEIPGLEFAAFSRPAQIVGGDYFDFVHFADGSHGIAIADVAGHGVSSSLLMASLQTALRTLAMVSASPEEVVGRIDHLYHHNINFASFVTLFLGRFDFAHQSFTYCNAGHNPPLFLHNGKSNGSGPDWLHPTGAAIGLVEGATYQANTVHLQPGDVLVLYTDGVTEAANPQGEQYGWDRLAEALHAAGDISARRLVAALRTSLQDFSAGQPLDDDTTIVVCKINGA
jgi:sigma-B regulation protein RsbU (phosphoserine phosphatase)